LIRLIRSENNQKWAGNKKTLIVKAAKSGSSKSRRSLRSWRLLPAFTPKAGVFA
jgi:hypothetical protein